MGMRKKREPQKKESKHFTIILSVLFAVLFVFNVMGSDMSMFIESLVVNQRVEEPLFDIKIDIPQEYKEILSGEQLLTSIKLVNLGSQGRIDVMLQYIVEDKQNKVILEETETVAVETQNNFVRYIALPPNIPAGIYSVYAKLIYFDGKKYASARSSFRVVDEQEPSRMKDTYYLVGIGALLVIAIATIVNSLLIKRILLEKERKRRN